MQKEPDPGPARQPVVLLDVGGKQFKMHRDTVDRYPDSLICKTVREFPRLVERGEPLFIDRNPSAFPWIQEIYRDGDYEDLPELSLERLQKELDFYQLPPVHLAPPRGCVLGSMARHRHAEDLLKKIMQEISVCGLGCFHPWTALIYHVIRGGRLETEQKIYVSPPLPLADMEYVQRRGHGEFDRALQLDSDRCPRQAVGDRTKLTPAGQDISFLFWKKGSVFIDLLQEEGAKHGLEFKEATQASFFLSTGKIVYGHFILTYKSSS